MQQSTRLGLDEAQTSDNISGFPAVNQQAMDILDGSVITSNGTLASRPAASTIPAGNEYHATDVGQWARSDGTNWHTYLAAGDLRYSAATSAPTGWLLCDGSAVSRTTYAALFSAIGATWGAGDGSSTFNLPDLRSRFPVAAGQGAGLSSRGLAQTGGEESHLLSTAEMPSHTHTDTGHSHPSGGNGEYLVTSPGNPQYTGPYVSGSGIQVQTAAPNPGYASLSSTGGGGTHNNMPPFAVVNAFIKT